MAMFAVKPPSSSNPTKRLSQQSACSLEAFRRLRLQIGGANIAGADRAVEPAYFGVARRPKTRPLTPPQHGGGAIRV
jgi:hypothetical protein